MNSDKKLEVYLNTIMTAEKNFTHSLNMILYYIIWSNRCKNQWIFYSNWILDRVTLCNKVSVKSNDM